MVYKYTFQGQDQNLDYSGHLSPHGILMRLLEFAGRAADEGGFGVYDIAPDNRTWVISRMAIDLYETLDKGIPYTVETWITPVDRIVSTRLMTVSTPDGRKVAQMTTLWSMIDKTTRRPVDLTTYASMSALVTEDTIDTATIRIPEPKGEVVRHHTIAYSDVDFNRHANSLRYLQWMLDTYPQEHFEGKRLERIDLNYMREALWGDEVDICREQNDGHDSFEIRIEGKSICRCILHWTNA